MVEREPKDEAVTFERQFKLQKFNNCTVAFNVSSKEFRFKVYFVKCVIK